MQQITTIGLDLAKQVFQVHGAEADDPRSLALCPQHPGLAATHRDVPGGGYPARATGPYWVLKPREVTTERSVAPIKPRSYSPHRSGRGVAQPG
jgi:hypothetical protein